MESNFSNGTDLSFKGKKGPTGDKGASGSRGIIGDKGEKGGKGPRGDRGEIGDMGDPGPKGEKGDKGETGPSGPKGPKGEKGEKGDTGIHGEKGDRGEDGYNGKDGERGPKGDRGDTGERGFIGAVGDDGEPGETGDKGFNGDKGPRGSKGEIGPRGDRGEVGPPGAKGDLGPRGDKGPQGDKGETGPIGDAGDNGKMLPPANEVIIARVAKDLINHNVEVYVDIKISQNVVFAGVNRIQTKTIISRANIAYIEFREGTIVPIKNIESFNIILDKNDVNKQNMVTNMIKGIFNDFYDCKGEKGELIENWSYEDEWFKDNGVYIPHCEYNNETNSYICKGKRVDTCRYISSTGEALGKIANKYKEQGKKVTEVFTTKNSIFALGAIKEGTIIDAAGGVMLMSYNIDGSVGSFKCLALVNLPNVVAMRII